MILVPTAAALVGALLPYTGLAHLFGFSVLPTKFFLLLFAMVVVYLVLVEVAKSWFFQSQSPHLAVTTTTHAQRLNRRIMKRASRFVRHEGPSLR
jgi:Mg2+-importing ATPase